MARSSELEITRFLSLLRSAGPTKFVSGQTLAKRTGMSRSAVWKKIHRLRRYGYGIESVQGLGYRLVHNTQLPVPWELKKLLKTKFIGKDVIYMDTAESTQGVALDLASKKQEANGTVVIANEQRNARGRLKRKWISPPGGLWFSVLLRPEIPTAAITLLPFVAALAVREAIVRITSLDAHVKWPNDVMISARKVAGILLDVSTEAEHVNYAVIGIGINANIDESEIALKIVDTQGITSLKTELGREVDMLGLLALILEKLEGYLDLLTRSGASAIISEWKNCTDMLGRRVVVSQNYATVHEGLAIDLLEDGSLVVQAESGNEITVTSGDVRVRY